MKIKNLAQLEIPVVALYKRDAVVAVNETRCMCR